MVYASSSRASKRCPIRVLGVVCVHKVDFECSIDASGYKAEAQDFLSDLNILLFKEALRKGSPTTTTIANNVQSIMKLVKQKPIP